MLLEELKDDPYYEDWLNRDNDIITETYNPATIYWKESDRNTELLQWEVGSEWYDCRSPLWEQAGVGLEGPTRYRSVLMKAYCEEEVTESPFYTPFLDTQTTYRD